MFLVSCRPFILWIVRTWRSFHNRFDSGTGTAIKSRRLMVTPGRRSGVSLADLFSTQIRRPTSQSAKACRAVVLPELFGPIKTTVFPSSISISSSRLKFLTRRFVSTFDDDSARSFVRAQAVPAFGNTHRRQCQAEFTSIGKHRVCGGLRQAARFHHVVDFEDARSQVCRLGPAPQACPLRSRPGATPFFLFYQCLSVWISGPLPQSRCSCHRRLMRSLSVHKPRKKSAFPLSSQPSTT